MKTHSKFLRTVAVIGIVLITHVTHSQQWEWAKAAHSVSPVTDDVATDASENIYMVHHNIVGGNGIAGIFVSKMNRHGALLWDKSLACCNVSYSPLRIAVDAAQNVYIIGTYYSSLQFGTITLTGSSTPYTFLAKIAPQGNIVWAKNVAGPSEPSQIHDIVIDTQGNVIITGSVKGTAFFDTIVSPSNSTTPTAYVSKYNASGKLLWVRRASGSESSGISLDTDEQGNLYAIGSYQGGVQWGTLSLPFSVSPVSYMIKMSAGGTALWGKKIPAQIAGIATDGAGYSYLSGHFSGTISLGNRITLSSVGQADIMIARFAPGGNTLWARSATSLGVTSVYDLDIDQQGNCYLVGGYHAKVSFGTKTLGSPTQVNSAGFTARYSPGGQIDWATPIVPNDYTYAERISTSAAGRCYIVVDNLESGNKLEFGTDLILSNAGNHDVIAKLDGQSEIPGVIVQLNTFACFPCFTYPDPVTDYEYRFWPESRGISAAIYRKVSDRENQDDILWRGDYLAIGLHDELPEGTYYFQLRALSGNRHSDWTDPVAFRGEIPTAYVFPNSVQEILNIHYETPEEEVVTLALLNRYGRVILSEERTARRGTNEWQLEVPAVRTGDNPLNLQLISPRQASQSWSLIRE